MGTISAFVASAFAPVKILRRDSRKFSLPIAGIDLLDLCRRLPAQQRSGFLR